MKLTKEQLKDIMEIFDKDGETHVMFKNKPNNTTQTFIAKDVFDVLNEFMKGADDD